MTMAIPAFLKRIEQKTVGDTRPCPVNECEGEQTLASTTGPPRRPRRGRTVERVGIPTYTWVCDKDAGHAQRAPRNDCRPQPDDQT